MGVDARRGLDQTGPSWVPFVLAPRRILYGLALPRQQHRHLRARLGSRREQHGDGDAGVVWVENLDHVARPLRQDDDHHGPGREQRLARGDQAGGRTYLSSLHGGDIPLCEVLEAALVVLPLGSQLYPREANEESALQRRIVLRAVVAEVSAEGHLEPAPRRAGSPAAIRGRRRGSLLSTSACLILRALPLRAAADVLLSTSAAAVPRALPLRLRPAAILATRAPARGSAH
mmetsp:Transcript_69342/g.201116  ORF Transcript_69342/g.201116 Transcript_69342/m.201116 type:complete len:231 (-) Transcript_69342:132-824(-)